MTLREYLIANMGDVNDDTNGFLDEVCELVAVWLVEQSGVSDSIERYYRGDA